MCVDYRTVNLKTKENAYQLLGVDEFLDTLGNSKLFSMLDLAIGYYQEAMDLKHREKPAFTTLFSLYEFQRMPMDFAASTSNFQRQMQCSVNDLMFRLLLVYLNDIFV